jgi:hypothetical protein
MSGGMIIWSALHSLKGDLMVLDESDERREIIQIIGSMRSTVMIPDKFIVRWRDVRAKIVELQGNGSPRRESAAHQDEQEGK